MKYVTLISAAVLFILSGCIEKQSQQTANPKENVMTFQTTNISISIDNSKERVYQFASNPENFPKWLAFVKSVSKKSNTLWNAESDLGNIEIELTPVNEFGIIDHKVKLPDGTQVYNPLRVIENGKGSEVIFTLYKMPDKTEEEFNADANLVKADLKVLKDILEK